MAWDIHSINDAISEIEQHNRTHHDNIVQWRKMWHGDFWTDEDYDAARIDNRDLITTSLPYNIVNLAQRIISNDPEVCCPNPEGNELGRLNADRRQQWLEIMWDRQGKRQPMSVAQSLKSHMLVDGAACAEVTWVNKLIPKAQRPFVDPILIRALDPLCVGVCYGPLGPEFAYHRYEDSVIKLCRRYPGVTELYDPEDDPHRSVTVTDFWYADKSDGKIYNALIVGDAGGYGEFIPVKKGKQRKFRKEPQESEYPMIPIVCRYNDPTPFHGVQANGILAPMEEPWRQLNLTMSMVMTGMKKHFWPEIYLKSRYDDADDIERGEGAVNVLQDPDADFLSPPGGRPDYNIAGQVLELMRGDAEDGTFPRALFGDSGAQRSGFGLALMTSAGTGRVSETTYQLEKLMESVNELALCFVEKFAGPNGVELFGYDSQDGGAYGVTLTKEMVSTYENIVRLRTTIEGDKLQELIAAMQMYDRNLISDDTAREYAPRPVKRDEKQRALMHRVEQDPDVFRERAAQAWQAYYGYPLPQGEPDMQPNTQDRLRAEAAAQQQAAQQLAPQQAQTLPGAGLDPALQGQLTGGQILQDFGQSADVNQLVATGRLPSVEDFLRQQRGTFSR